MQYRPLGKTGLHVSVIGLGCVMIGSSSTEYAVQVIRRALDLGVTYFDTARGYWDAEIKLGIALEKDRSRVIISTKTGALTREDAWREINESLERLRTDHVDNCHLHALKAGEDMERRLGPGGALEALLQAKEQGMIRHIGCSSHRSDTLIAALDRFPFEIILVPMNVVERQPLETLIPLCHERGVGVTIMKPLATGLLPATLALKWLLNQPIACAVPGATTLAEVEENCLVGHDSPALTEAEQARIEELRQQYDHVRCRLCAECLPCPKGIPVDIILGTDVMYDHYRTMGPDAFRSFTWARDRIEREAVARRERIALIESCNRCGECTARCPYGLPVMDMLLGMVPAMKDMLRIYGEILAA